MERKRYALVGAGSRGLGMFALPIANELRETAELVGIFDTNPLRAAYAVSRLPQPVPRYTDFDRMLREANPDAVIVATRDCAHAQYVVGALRAGKRAYSEKPLCTTAAQCREILAALRESGQTCLTTHNARYGAAAKAVREVLRSGRLGEIRFVQFDETLDRCHGADYFRRWHRNKANTGGLQIHKASHHFDLLNWWASSKPVRVAARGSLRFYGRNNPFRSQRCRGCPHADRCEFHVDMFASDSMKGMYLDAESADGYLRDGCVWDESIDIEDQLAVQIEYKSGLLVSYTLLAYSPIETLRVVMEGTRGRLELCTIYNTGWAVGKTRVPGIETIATEAIRLFLPNEGIEDVPIQRPEGGHGGADPQLRSEFFARDWSLPPTDAMASAEQAVQAVLIGAAVNKSLATGRAVRVQELLKP